MLALFTHTPVHRLREPRFEVSWESRSQILASSLRAVFGGPKAPKEFRGEPYFRDSWVRTHWPTRTVLVSALLHVALVYFPFPQWSFLRPVHEPLLPRADTKLTYYGPIRDLPLVNPTAPPARPRRPGESEKRLPLPRRGADAYHPRQTIISAPKMPTHPRRTLIQPDGPMAPPKILPPMPNTVQWANAAGPTKPKLQISREALARLRPKKPAMRPADDVPVPDVPNQEKALGGLAIASSEIANARPRMPVSPAVVPRTGPRQAGDAGAAPDVRSATGGGDSGVQRLVSISPSPDDGPSNLPAPSGNLAARVSISPEGRQPGTPGGSPTGAPSTSGAAGGTPGASRTQPGAGGTGDSGALRDLSISGGNPNANSSSLSSSGSASSPPPPAPAPRVESTPPPPDPEPAPATPSISAMKPGSVPEAIFGPRRIYTLHVNMPNLASVTGSWVLSFVEMGQPDGAPAPSIELTGPVPLRKVDPRYPNSMIDARVEGEVVLYAVIRRDGSVDSIQVVRGLEPELDQNAMEALARWKFRPAERRGAPVELEAIVHIPFHMIAR
jgi:TonB family protein